MSKRKYESPVITRINDGLPDKFGMQPPVKHISKIEGIAVNELIEQYGSPLFVFSESSMRKEYQKLYRAFSSKYPKVQLAWSYKTNYLDAVCRIFHDEGAWAEVVSGFEYDKALANGVAGEKIIFNGPYKTDEELIKAVENNSLIHIDHFDELYSLLNIAEKIEKRPQTAIRINMDTGIYPKWDRFGFNYENGEAWTAVNRIMLSKKIDLVGLHTHIGTYLMAAEPYGVAAAKIAGLAAKIDQKFDHKIKYIDMGGGFASDNTLKGAYLPGKDTSPSYDDYAEAITTALINSSVDPGHLPTLFLETGRSLITNAGTMLSTVVANKRLSDGRRALIIDAGVNLLFTSFWYDFDIYPSEKTGSHAEDTVIYGPLCMNIDVIRDAVKFPHLEKGQHLVIPKVGAYNVTQWLQFITLRPNVVLIDPDKNTHIIRKKEDLDTFARQEQTPEHLK